MAVQGEDAARVERLPLRKMMHLMVQGRQLSQGKKKEEKAVSEGVVTKFALERQGIERHKAKLDFGDWSKQRSPLPRISLSFEEEAVVDDDDGDASGGKFAYISLDGRLMNADLATSARSIGGALGDAEARAWEDFVPMQRVLIVAVSAAAAAAAKHRSREEVERLLRTVEKRVRNHDHSLLSLCNLVLSCLRAFFCTLVTTLGDTSLWSLLSWSGMLTGRLNLLPSLWSPSQENELFSLRQELTNLRTELTAAPLSVRVSPKTPPKMPENVRVNLDEAWSSSQTNSPCQSDSCGSSANEAETAKWYVNPMVETLEDFYNISTPERTNSMFSLCNPAVQGSFEWEVLRSSFATRMIRSSSMVSDASITQDSSSLEDKDHVAIGALCAAVILDLRKRMLSVLDKEAAMVMDALDTMDAKAQLESMHSTVSSHWNASVVKALAALSLSPSEFDCWRLNEGQGAASALNDTSKLEDSVVAWRQYLEKTDASEKRHPNRFRSKASADEGLAPLACPRYIGRRIGGLKDFSGDSLDKVAVMKKLEHDIGAIAQVKGCADDVAELVKQLESKEVEVADLKKGQQALLEAKNREIEELKEDFKKRDVELDKRLAAVETTKADSADRLAMLEKICREKESALSNMKQDIQALESKVHQSTASQRAGRRYSTPAASSSMSGTGPSSQRRTPSIHEDVGHFKERLPSIKSPLPYIPTQRHEELTDDGRSEQGYDHETSHDYSSPSESTIGDDCSVNSLAFSETEVESCENFSSGDDSRSKDRLKTIQKHKSSSAVLRRAVTSTATSGCSLSRTQSSKSLTSGSSSSKTLQRTYSGEVKKNPVTIKDPNSTRTTSLGTSNLKGVGATAAANHRRAASLDMTFKPSPQETPNSQDHNSAPERKRWV